MAGASAFECIIHMWSTFFSLHACRANKLTSCILISAHPINQKSKLEKHQQLEGGEKHSRDTSQTFGRNGFPLIAAEVLPY